MESIRRPVKRRRRYNSQGRQAQARRSRGTILDAAQRRFLEGGYAATTVAAIADEAGVSVETVYKAFGGKPGLVRGIYERGLAGREPVPAFERSDAMRERETDPRAIMRGWGVLASEVASVVSPILLLVRSAAATEPDLEALLRASNATHEERARHHARFLQERGYLRQGVTPAQAADILWTCMSPEFYDLLVLQRGWSPPEFARFLADFMIGALLPPAPGPP
jgi:AcrR family transcriptional regulator